MSSSHLSQGRSPEVLVDFSAVQPDGCVSLETELTRRHLAAEGIELSEEMPLVVFQWWIRPMGRRFRTPLVGEARHSSTWGWGADISPKSLKDLGEGCGRVHAQPEHSDQN